MRKEFQPKYIKTIFSVCRSMVFFYNEMKQITVYTIEDLPEVILRMAVVLVNLVP